MLTLYHLPIAICAQKTRVCLAEKGVAWEARNVEGQFRSPEYLKLNPAGYVPTLVHDGRVITESRVISEYIDEAFEGPALQPTDPYQRTIMRRWTKQIDETLHPFIFVLSFVPLFRDQILQLPLAEQEKSVPLDPVKAGRMRDMMRLGWDSPWLLMAIQRFEKLAIELEAALTATPWLAGEAYSLADADYTPYLQRMEDLGLSWLWADRPALTDWYVRVRARPSYAAVVDDWVSPDARTTVAIKAVEIAPRFQAILARAKASDHRLDA